jgi:hypothetical protein
LDFPEVRFFRIITCILLIVIKKMILCRKQQNNLLGASMTMDSTPELPTLPCGTFGPEFECLLTATVNKIDREWPAKWRACFGAAYVVESIARVTRNTHLSLCYLCAQEPPDSARKAEFALSAIPVVRSLLDTVFLLVFLFEDLPARSLLYLKSGWRELTEEFERYNALYHEDPTWKEWLEEFRRGLKHAEDLALVSPEESANPGSITFWPTPGQMLKSNALSPAGRTFLQHLNDWFYRNFSSYSHLSLPGLIMRSEALRPNSDAEDERIRQWRVDKQRSDAMAMEIMMGLAIISEIDAACRFGLHTRLRYVWGMLNGYYGFSRDLYGLRYDGLLRPSGT